MPPTKELSQKEVKSVLETQVKAIGKQMQNIKELVFSVVRIKNFVDVKKNPEQLASLIEELVADVIFEEHGCENEDIEASVKNYVDDQEIKDLLSKISESLTKLN